MKCKDTELYVLKGYSDIVGVSTMLENPTAILMAGGRIVGLLDDQTQAILLSRH